MSDSDRTRAGLTRAQWMARAAEARGWCAIMAWLLFLHWLRDAAHPVDWAVACGWLAVAVSWSLQWYGTWRFIRDERERLGVP